MGERHDGNKHTSAGNPAVNKIIFEETDKKRSFRAELTDPGLQTVGDSLGMFIGTRLRRQVVQEQPQITKQLALRGVVEGNGTAGPEVATGGPSNDEHKPRIDANALAGTDGNVMEILHLHLDRSAHPKVFDAPSLRDKALHVLWIAKNEFSVDGLTSPQIADILRGKFGIKASRQGVATALDNAVDLVDRVPGEKGAFRYRLMAAGEKYLEDPTSYTPRRVSRGRSTKRSNLRRNAKSDGHEQSDTKASERAHARRSGSRLGLRGLLTALANEGYFTTPRIIGEIKTYLKDQRGHPFETNELSPVLLRLVKDNVLNRSKRDDDGQYEYTTK